MNHGSNISQNFMEQSTFAPWRDHVIDVPKALIDSLGRPFLNDHIKVRVMGRDCDITDPTIPSLFVLGGISANRIVTSESGTVKGWNHLLCGPDKTFDSNHYRIISMDYLVPSRHPDDQAFYDISPAIQANAAAHVLDHLGIDKVAAFIGGSYGGMVGQHFAAHTPARLGQLFSLCAAHIAGNYGLALRHIQRTILLQALNTENEVSAVDLARQLAIISYRSPEEFEARFDATSPESDIYSYLRHQGQKFAKSHDIWTYGCLSKSIDLHRIDASDITVPTALFAIDSDVLVPVKDIEAFTKIAPQAESHVVHSPYGHDGFLLETQAITNFFKPKLETDHG